MRDGSIAPALSANYGCPGRAGDEHHNRVQHSANRGFDVRRPGHTSTGCLLNLARRRCGNRGLRLGDRISAVQRHGESATGKPPYFTERIQKSGGLAGSFSMRVGLDAERPAAGPLAFDTLTASPGQERARHRQFYGVPLGFFRAVRTALYRSPAGKPANFLRASGAR